MRLVAVVVALGALGCDDTLGNGLVADGHGSDSGLSTGDTGVVSTTKISDATQVGSEGFWGCPIEKVEPIEPTAAPLGFEGGVGDAVQGHLGTWPLAVVDAATAATATGALELAVGEVWRWVDVAEGTGCEDHVLASVSGVLTRDGGPPMALSGLVAVRPDGQGGLVATADRAVAEPMWGVGTYGGSLFPLEGGLGITDIDATAAYADCAASEPHCEGATPLADLTGTR